MVKLQKKFQEDQITEFQDLTIKDGSFATTLVAESVLHKLRNTGTGNVGIL